MNFRKIFFGFVILILTTVNFYSCNNNRSQTTIEKKGISDSEIVSFKSYECKRSSHSDYEKQENWEVDAKHSKDSIISYGESYFKFILSNGSGVNYKVLKNNGPLLGRPSGARGFSFICKNQLGDDVEIFFERNDITNTFVIVLFETDYVYEYKVNTKGFQ